jgi:hypothetical protein
MYFLLTFLFFNILGTNINALHKGTYFHDFEWSWKDNSTIQYKIFLNLLKNETGINMYLVKLQNAKKSKSHNSLKF